MERVRDRCWIWGHEAGSHDAGWDIPGSSRMTPAEGAFYLGVPNLIMVRYGGKPSPPFDQYAVPFRALKNVVWSIVGAGGQTQDEERTHVLELAARFPVITGVMMDDFFRSPTDGGEMGALSLDELRGVQDQLKVSGRKLNLWVVLYNHQLTLPVEEHLSLCDKVAFWTWKAHDLKDLERNFEVAEKKAPSCGKVLGCYMWDYGEKVPMPLDQMKMQCETGLRWLREGRIEGMIFLASCICDLEIETVEWTRDWIAEVGDEHL